MNGKIVTQEVLLIRLNEWFCEQEDRLPTGTAEQQRHTYYIADRFVDFLMARHCDLETLARELGVLADDEYLRKDLADPI